MKVLVCDDEPGIRRSLSQILTDEGYEVETVGLGQEAAARADMTYRVIDGYNLASHDK